MRKSVNFLPVLALTFGILFGYATNAMALASWTRKYNVPCSNCHRPNIPRLNPEGHRFRKLGYRFPQDMGTLPGYKEIGDYLSARGRESYRHQDADEEAAVSRFETNATAFYAGPITANLSAFFEGEWQDNNDIRLNGFGQWTKGSQDDYWALRLGQFYPLYRRGFGGFDRPSAISSPKVFTTQLTSSPIPFIFNEPQKGLEADWDISRDTRLIGGIFNGFNYAGTGSRGSADDDRYKDLLVAYETILDEDGSGLTLEVYRGIWTQNPAGTNGGVVVGTGDDRNKFIYYRYGGSFSWMADIIPSGLSELQAGALFSFDNVPSSYPGIGNNIKGQGYFVELEQFLGDASAFLRTDFIELDTSAKDWEKTYTLGTAYMVNEYLRLAGEVYYIEDKRLAGNTGISGGNDEPGVLLEAQLNF